MHILAGQIIYISMNIHMHMHVLSLPVCVLLQGMMCFCRGAPSPDGCPCGGYEPTVLYVPFPAGAARRPGNTCRFHLLNPVSEHVRAHLQGHHGRRPCILTARLPRVWHPICF